jgi:hypothetical protein
MQYIYYFTVLVTNIKSQQGILKKYWKTWNVSQSMNKNLVSKVLLLIYYNIKRPVYLNEY